MNFSDTSDNIRRRVQNILWKGSEMIQGKKIVK